MKSQIKTIIVAAWLLLAPNQLLAWQAPDASDEQSAVSAESGANKNGTDDARDGATAKPTQGSGIKPSTPQDDAPPEYLDGTFLWNPAWQHVYSWTQPSSSERPQKADDLQLSEEQVAIVKTLSEDSKKQLKELIEAMRNAMIDRGGIELAGADQEKAMRWQQEQNRSALTLKRKFGQAFMELLSEPQRNEMYRRSVLMGGAFALLEPSLREKFQLTEAQAESLHKIRDENWHSLRTHFLSANSRQFKNAEPYLATAYEQLTDEQKAQYQKFIATPFVESKAEDAVQAADTKQPGGIGMPGSAVGSFGPNGFFYPSGGFGGASSGNFREVSSNGLMITWSENNDEVRGFSNSKGDWEILKIEKQDRIIPVVGDEVGAVRIGNSMAAFSAAKAQWDVIKLSEDSTAVPSVFKGYVKVEDNGHLYTFADAKGQWTSPTDPELQPATKQLALKRIQSDDERAAFDQWLHSLPLYKGRGIRLMFQNGEVTVHTTRQSWMKETLAALEEFSRETDSSGAESTTLPGSARSIDQIESDISKFRDEFKTLELAVRDGVKKADSSSAGKDDQHRELRRLVEKSFDLRQQLQRMEAQRMKLKLQLIETNLDAREKARGAIIERRLEELRNGNVQPTATIQSQNFGIPITGAPIGLAGPPNIPMSGPVGLESRPANSDSRIQWPQPTEIVKELRKYRSDFLHEYRGLRSTEGELKRWSQKLETLIEKGELEPGATEEQRESELVQAKQFVVSKKNNLDKLKRDRDYAWSAYQSKLRLLKLDVAVAKASQDALQENIMIMELMDRQAEASNSDLLKAQLIDLQTQIPNAKINLQRAEELLKLYADIETQEPELNPDSLNAEK